MRKAAIFGGLDSTNRPYDLARDRKVSEDPMAAWVKFDIEAVVGGVPVSGNGCR